MRVTCLANSWKEGGRCIAGIDIATGRWVRPVSRAEHGQLSLEQSSVLQNGRLRQIEPLDIVDFGQLQPVPLTGQPENVRLGTLAPSYVGKSDIEALRVHADQRPFLLHGTGSSVAEADAHLVQASLCLIRVEQPMFRVNPTNQRQLRVVFVHSGTQYDLPVTDASTWAELAKINPGGYSNGIWYLTISLGVPWNGRMYKLVASGLPENGNPHVYDDPF
jgi:hypothetical protein